MARLIAADITDELVKPVVLADTTILDECDEYLNDLAQSKGSLVSYMAVGEYTINDIPDPLPYKVKKLAVMWVCREVCSRKAGSGGLAFKGQDTTDKWANKMYYFAKQVDALESQITPEVLLGILTSSAVGQITLERG